MPADAPERSDRDHERPFELFVSYAHASEPVKDRLLVHLAPLKLAGLVATWTDRKILPGDLWYDEIQSAIAREYRGHEYRSPTTTNIGTNIGVRPRISRAELSWWLVWSSVVSSTPSTLSYGR